MTRVEHHIKRLDVHVEMLRECTHVVLKVGVAAHESESLSDLHFAEAVDERLQTGLGTLPMAVEGVWFDDDGEVLDVEGLAEGFQRASKGLLLGFDGLGRPIVANHENDLLKNRLGSWTAV